MKIRIQSNLLKDSVAKIVSIIDRKNTRPILSNILINTKKEKIDLIATDLEISVSLNVTAECSEEMSFCVNSKNLHDLLRELPSDILEVEVDKKLGEIYIKCRSISYKIFLQDSNDFPKIEFKKDYSKYNFKVNSEKLLKIINKTFYAISTDETRINLNGLHWQEVDNIQRFVSIDGHKLALYNHQQFINNPYLKEGIIIPRKGLLELKKLCDLYLKEDIKININNSFIDCCVDDTHFISIRLIAREYPKYQNILPSKIKEKATVDKNNLCEAIKRVKLLSNEKTNGIKLEFYKNQLKLTSGQTNIGLAEETIDIDYSGEEIKIGFNAKYILESLQIFETETINIEFNNELSPVVLKSSEFPEFLGIVMPLKI